MGETAVLPPQWNPAKHSTEASRFAGDPRTFLVDMAASEKTFLVDEKNSYANLQNSSL